MRFPVRFHITEKRVFLAVSITLVGICVFFHYRSEEHFEGLLICVPEIVDFMVSSEDKAFHFEITIAPEVEVSYVGFFSPFLNGTKVVRSLNTGPELPPFDFGFRPDFGLKFSLAVWVKIPFTFLAGLFSAIFFLILFIKPKRWKD